jgi:hypothetical protein
MVTIINNAILVSSLLSSVYANIPVAMPITLLNLTQGDLAILLLLLQSKNIMRVKLRRSIPAMRLHISRVPILLTIEALIAASPIPCIAVLAIVPGVAFIAEISPNTKASALDTVVRPAVPRDRVFPLPFRLTRLLIPIVVLVHGGPSVGGVGSRRHVIRVPRVNITHRLRISPSSRRRLRNVLAT